MAQMCLGLVGLLPRTPSAARSEALPPFAGEERSGDKPTRGPTLQDSRLLSQGQSAPVRSCKAGEKPVTGLHTATLSLDGHLCGSLNTRSGFWVLRVCPTTKRQIKGEAVGRRERVRCSSCVRLTPTPIHASQHLGITRAQPGALLSKEPGIPP